MNGESIAKGRILKDILSSKCTVIGINKGTTGWNILSWGYRRGGKITF
jgi:hypothetical protein